MVPEIIASKSMYVIPILVAVNAGFARSTQLLSKLAVARSLPKLLMFPTDYNNKPCFTERQNTLHPVLLVNVLINLHIRGCAEKKQC